jgi:hypothetical protein
MPVGSGIPLSGAIGDDDTVVVVVPLPAAVVVVVEFDPLKCCHVSSPAPMRTRTITATKIFRMLQN